MWRRPGESFTPHNASPGPEEEFFSPNVSHASQTSNLKFICSPHNHKQRNKYLETISKSIKKKPNRLIYCDCMTKKTHTHTHISFTKSKMEMPKRRRIRKAIRWMRATIRQPYARNYYLATGIVFVSFVAKYAILHDIKYCECVCDVYDVYSYTSIYS